MCVIHSANYSIMYNVMYNQMMPVSFCLLCYIVAGGWHCQTGVHAMLADLQGKSEGLMKLSLISDHM